MIRQILVAVTVVFSVCTKADDCTSDQIPQYVTASSLNIRAEPRSDARILDTLPIGTPIYVLGQRTQNEMGEVTCGPLLIDQWLSVCTHLDEIDPICANDAHGWAIKDMVEVERPRLEALLTKHDATPKTNLPERRKWAERAAALDPADLRAQERLIAVLQSAGDEQTISSWRKKFADYLNPQPSLAAGEKKAILIFSDSKLSQLCFFDSNDICKVFSTEDVQQHRYMVRGKYYFVYSEGRHVGAVVTERTNCAGGRCASTVPVRFLPNSKGEKIVSGLATNFVLPNTSPPPGKITGAERSMLLALADRWLNSGKRIPDADCPSLQEFREQNKGHAPEQLQFAYARQTEWCESHNAAKLALLSGVKSGEYLRSMIAARSPKGRMLVGLWGLGTFNDAHYSNSPFIAFLLTAEPGKDGVYKITFADTNPDDCWISDHADLNSDGTDEILLTCDQLEGHKSMALMRRQGSQWTNK